jgi:hypothetical protein
MATYADDRERRVVAVYVAIGALAGWNSMQAGQRERRVVMVERRIRPRHGVVANLALLRESGSPVIWIRGAVEIVQMACDAGGAVQGVVIVDVAIRALPRRYGVGSGQREPGGVVIELSVGP